MRWGDWPAAAKAVAVGSLLLLALLGIVALKSVSSPTGGATVARFALEGALFDTEYELRNGGVLVTNRYTVGGGLMERRQRVLPAADDAHYRDLLELGGYFSAEPESLRLPEVQRTLGALTDVSHWRIKVHRSRFEAVDVEVPVQAVGHFFPALAEVPYVAAAWELLDGFEASWDSSQQVAP
jgi:hypothetical protein